MDEAALLPFREYHARRARQLRQERETLRLGVLERAREAIRRSAPAFSALRAVHLFGSILARDVDVRPRIGPIARAVEEGGELCYERKLLVLERALE